MLLVIKKGCNVAFQSSKNEEMTFQHEFVFVIIRYFNGAILLEKSCKKQWFRKNKKRKESHKGGWGGVY